MLNWHRSRLPHKYSVIYSTCTEQNLNMKWLLGYSRGNNPFPLFFKSSYLFHVWRDKFTYTYVCYYQHRFQNSTLGTFLSSWNVPCNDIANTLGCLPLRFGHFILHTNSHLNSTKMRLQLVLLIFRWHYSFSGRQPHIIYRRRHSRLLLVWIQSCGSWEIATPMTPAASSAERTDQLSLHGFVKMTWCIEGQVSLFYSVSDILLSLWGVLWRSNRPVLLESLWFPAPSSQQQRWEQPKEESPSHLTDKQGLTLCFRNLPQLNLSGKPWWILFQAKENKKLEPAVLAPPAQHKYSNIYQPGRSRVLALIFTLPQQPALSSTPQSLRLLANVEDWGLCITELKSSCLGLWDSPS